MLWAARRNSSSALALLGFGPSSWAGENVATWHTAKQKHQKHQKQQKTEKKKTTFRSRLLCHGTWDKDRQSGKFKSCQRWVLSSVESNHKQPDLIVTSPEKFEPCCGTWKQPQVSATPVEPTANSWWLQSQHIYKLLLLQSVSKWTPKSPKNSVPFSIFQRNIEHVRPWPASYVQGTDGDCFEPSISVATCYAKQRSSKLRAMCLPLRLCIAALCNGCWLWMLGFVAHLLRLSHEDLEDHEVNLPYFAMVRSLTSYEINAWRLRRLRRLHRLLRLTCLTFSRLNGVIAGISCNYFRINQISHISNKINIHPASRGVAAHTASLFRSVRGAKGGFPPWGLPKLRIFTFPPRGGSPS